MMKKTSRILAAVLLGAMLVSCKQAGVPSSQSIQQEQEQPKAVHTVVEKQQGLRLVANRFDTVDKTKAYYSFDTPHGGGYANVLRFNYETMQQEYVCDKPAGACLHNTPECTSYLEDIQTVFSNDEYLFVLKPVSSGEYGETVWEKRSLEGTVLQTVNNAMTDSVYADDAFLYYDVIIQQEEESVWHLYKMDIETMQSTLLLSGKDIAQKNEYIHLLEFVQGNKLGISVIDDNQNARVVFYDTKANTWEEKEIEKNVPVDWGFLLDEAGNAYRLEDETKKLFHVNVFTGETVLETEYFTKYAGVESSSIYIKEKIDDYLLIGAHIQQEEWMFIYNTLTHDVTQITLACNNKGVPMPIQVWGKTPYGLLVTEENVACTSGTTGRELDGMPRNGKREYRVLAFMDMQDYISSTPNFNTIHPIEYGVLQKE